MEPLRTLLTIYVIISGLLLHSKTLGQVESEDGAEETPEAIQARHRAMENPNLFGGDMVGFKPADLMRKNHVAGYTWPGGVVPYTIHDSLKAHTSKILNAFKEYHDKTCIRFKPRTNEKAYINIEDGQGCNSVVGRLGNRQSVTLDKSTCLGHGTIVHELGHSLGLLHTHTRQDRDDHIVVVCRNLRPGTESQYMKLWGRVFAPYDTESIMHYQSYGFSKNGKPTILKLSGGLIKDPTHLSPTDVKAIKAIYKC